MAQLIADWISHWTGVTSSCCCTLSRRPSPSCTIEHRLRVATEASVFTDIEQLAWRIVQSDIRVFTSTSASKSAGSRTVAKTIEKHILDQVELLINFGGKQIHAREWKALLLMDISFFWIEQGDTGEHSPSKSATALLLLQAIFETVCLLFVLFSRMCLIRSCNSNIQASETRSEVLSCLFERCQKPSQSKVRWPL